LICLISETGDQYWLTGAVQPRWPI